MLFVTNNSVSSSKTLFLRIRVVGVTFLRRRAAAVQWLGQGKKFPPSKKPRANASKLCPHPISLSFIFIFLAAIPSCFLPDPPHHQRMLPTLLYTSTSHVANGTRARTRACLDMVILPPVALFFLCVA